MMHFIIRNRKKIFLTNDEIFTIYRFEHKKYLSEDVATLLDERCKQHGLFLKKKIRREFIEHAVSAYEDSILNSDDRITSCEFGINEAYDMFDDTEFDKKKFEFLSL